MVESISSIKSDALEKKIHCKLVGGSAGCGPAGKAYAPGHRDKPHPLATEWQPYFVAAGGVRTGIL